VTHKGGFVKLDDLNEPVFDFLKVVFFQKFSDSTLNFFVDLLWDIGLQRENIF
jgi:hypothetical protein